MGKAAGKRRHFRLLTWVHVCCALARVWHAHMVYGHTVQGSNLSAIAASMGTQTRPVLGWQAHGDLSK